jgi:nitrite reductase/ring-hydroxylating ferredoxin subunit
MELPVSVTDLGAQLRGTGEIAPDPALFSDPHVFAAERERIFQRSVMALDHGSRVAEDGRWIRCDAGPSSILVTREAGGRLHALRNLCLHAGYPVCDAEQGANERVICPYHGWEYTLDGRLVEPELSSRIDPARLRLRSYPVCVRNGLILVDPSGAGDIAEPFATSMPAWLTTATVAGRARHNTEWNWKHLRHLLQSSPQFFVSGPIGERHEFGPLSHLFVQSERAVLLRIIPRFAEKTDLQVIEMTADAPCGAESGAGSDGLAERLSDVAGSRSWFDRGFAEWYWSLMSSGE